MHHLASAGLCLGDGPGYKAGGRRVGSLGEADGQTALLAQGSCGHTRLWDRVDSGSLGSGVAWFLAGSSVLLRPLLLLALWAVLPFLGPSRTYIPGPRTKCQSTVHPQGHFQTLPEPKAQEGGTGTRTLVTYTSNSMLMSMWPVSFRSLWITSLRQVLG